MSATLASTQSLWKVARCPSCGTKGEFPSDSTNLRESEYCEVCRFHRGHELVYDFRCAICVARLWQSWLRALRIFFSRSEVLRSEDL
jgi:hypothetical protein